MAKQSEEVFTIGHSTVSFAEFLSKLQHVGVTAVADVRSSPFSGRLPHFSQPNLRTELKKNMIKYVPLGKELGGRPNSSLLYCNKVADYEQMALEPEFLQGLERVIDGAKTHRVALMCSEQDPLDCHRCLLVGRALAKRAVKVSHLLHDGAIIGQDEIEEKLLVELSGSTMDDMFASRDERLADAYRARAQKVAYRETPAQGTDDESHEQGIRHEAAE
jgi:uncharacterized protein (DUF488 family)